MLLRGASSETWDSKKEMKKLEMERWKLPITNYNFVYSFLPARIFICATAVVLPFRQGLQGRFCPQIITCGYEGYCLSGKG
jgi:hypothetical protein